MKKSYRKGVKVVLHLSPFQSRVLSELAKHDKCSSIGEWLMERASDNVEASVQIVNGGPVAVDRYFRRVARVSLTHADLIAYLQKYTPNSDVLVWWRKWMCM